MKKLIKLKHSTSALTEASVQPKTLADNEINTTRSRSIRLYRLASAAQEAAEKAYKAGNFVLANELSERAQKLFALADWRQEPSLQLDTSGGQGNGKGQGDGQGDGQGNGQGDGQGQGNGQGGNGGKNPFNATPKGMQNKRNAPKSSQSQQGSQNGQQSNETPGNEESNEKNQEQDTKDQEQENKKPDDFEDIKRILKQLHNGEKDGAKAALGDILAGRNIKTESLSEELSLNKNIIDMSESEFNEIIADTLAKIEQTGTVEILPNLNGRVAEITKANSDPVMKKELDDEDRAYTATEEEKYRLAKRELQKFSQQNKSRHSVKEFKEMLYFAIASQVKAKNDNNRSWAALNRRHQNDGILVPGIKQEEKPKIGTITLQVYLDCSGSFTDYDIETERSWLAVIDEFVKSGEVKVDLYYFADKIHPGTEEGFKQAREEGGTGAWPAIIENIQQTKPYNVMIVTDSDMNGAAARIGKHYYAPGCVFYVWKKYSAPNLPTLVGGNKKTGEFWM